MAFTAPVWPRIESRLVGDQPLGHTRVSIVASETLLRSLSLVPLAIETLFRGFSPVLSALLLLRMPPAFRTGVSESAAD
jgi:hypothetical protein